MLADLLERGADGERLGAVVRRGGDAAVARVASEVHPRSWRRLAVRLYTLHHPPAPQRLEAIEKPAAGEVLPWREGDVEADGLRGGDVRGDAAGVPPVDAVRAGGGDVEALEVRRVSDWGKDVRGGGAREEVLEGGGVHAAQAGLNAGEKGRKRERGLTGRNGYGKSRSRRFRGRLRARTAGLHTHVSERNRTPKRGDLRVKRFGPTH